MNLLRGHQSQSTAVATLFEIRVDSTERDVIVLRGSSADSSGSILKGVLVISLHDPIQARSITLTLRGKSRASWVEPFLTSSRAQGTRMQREEKTVYEKTWSFLPATSHSKTIGTGNYEYPFSVELPGDVPETVEGLEHGAITYTMQAIIDRPGFASNLLTRKHIRIVRTLSIDSLEMAQTLSVDNTWPNKIEYAISIPTKSYPIGSPIPISFKLVPLLKGLNIAKIVCTLKEYQSFTIKSGHHGSPAAKEVDRTVCSVTLSELEKDVPNWEIEQNLQLPSALTECIQDCEVGHIKIRHKLKFTVSLQNPDGHISELRAALPISLLIPPQLFSGGTNFSAMNPTDPENQLPSYDSHVYDRLYDGIETPLPSGMNTPAQSRSRRNSIEGDSHDSEATHRALVAGLHRLTTVSGQSTPPINVNGHANGSGGSTGLATPTSGNTTPYRSAPNSFTPAFSVDELAASLEGTTRPVRHGSPAIMAQDNDIPAPFTAEEMEGLSRIPSYGTATTRAAAGPLSGSLPDYNTSAPISTNNSGSNTPLHAQPSAPMLARPPAARTASHRSGVLRAAHDRLTRSRDH